MSTDRDGWDRLEHGLDELLDDVVEGTETARRAEHILQQRAQGLREMYGPANDGNGEKHR